MTLKVILPAQMGLFGDNHELRFETSQLQQKPLASPAKEKIIFWRRRKLGRLALNEKSVGEEQEFRVLMVSRWLSCWGGRFLVGGAAVPPSLLAPVMDDSFLLAILLETIIDSSSSG